MDDIPSLYFVLWRWFLLGLIVGGWPLGVHYLGQVYGWNDAHCQWVQRSRWRVAAWLLIIELLLVQGILPRFVQGMMA